RARAPESKEWEEAKLSGPGKHSQSAWSVFSLSMKGLFNRAQFPLTLCVFIVLFSIFGANWPIFGLLPTYLAGEGFDTGVVSNLMTA
ncbi:MFS transporter, partial [Salmonella enterica subsp. enterica serovar Enteritidis]|nr:MFS transporter [Salmonella enterica subsp. enterica serovar Enteritidis]